jgi:hypothetical protein
MGHTYTEAVGVDEKAPHAAHILDIICICGLDTPSAEMAEVAVGRGQEAAAQLAIIAKATSSKVGDAPNTHLEGVGGLIRHEVADS